MKFVNIITRTLVFTLGLCVMSFGVALSVKANLGISPISCIPYIVSLKVPLTLGQVTIGFNIILIIIQILLLRKKYRLFQLIQLPVVFVFGLFIDLAVFLTGNIEAVSYLPRLLLCLLSCGVMGVGVFLEVIAEISYLPGEGVALALSETLNIEFGKAKISVDSLMVVTGIIISFLILGSLSGIREGTVLAALLVGFFARLLVRKINVFDKVPTENY